MTINYLKCGLPEFDDDPNAYFYTELRVGDYSVAFPQNLNLRNIIAGSELYDFLVKSRVFIQGFAFHESLTCEYLFQNWQRFDTLDLSSLIKNKRFNEEQLTVIAEVCLEELKKTPLDGNWDLVHILDVLYSSGVLVPLSSYEEIMVDLGDYKSGTLAARSFEYFIKAYGRKRGMGPLVISDLSYEPFIDVKVLKFIEAKYKNSEMKIKELEYYAGFEYGIDPTILVDLSIHEKRDIVLAVAQNPNTPLETLHDLAKRHKTPNMRIAIARNVETPLWLLEEIYHGTKSESIRDAVMSNPLWPHSE